MAQFKAVAPDCTYVPRAVLAAGRIPIRVASSPKCGCGGSKARKKQPARQCADRETHRSDHVHQGGAKLSTLHQVIAVQRKRRKGRVAAADADGEENTKRLWQVPTRREQTDERTDQERASDVDDQTTPREIVSEQFAGTHRHQVSGDRPYRTANGDRDDELKVHWPVPRVATHNSKPPAIGPAIRVVATSEPGASPR